MKSIVAAIVALALPVAAAAQGRPDATNMTCAQARALVARAGAIVMGLGGPTYDRIVLHQGFCTPSEYIDPVFAPTLDNRACLVGHRCVERLIDADR